MTAMIADRYRGYTGTGYVDFNAIGQSIEWTATVLRPISLHAAITRRAISPRLAMSTLEIMTCGSSARPNREERLAELHRLRVLRIDLDDRAVLGGFDLVHQLHRFDDAENLPLLHPRADLHEHGSLGRRGAIERADDRRGQDVRTRRRACRRSCRSSVGRPCPKSATMNTTIFTS